jgi:hypothetical protein
MMRWNPGWFSAPHTYVTDRICVVVSGTWFVNSGNDFLPEDCVAVGPGGYVKRTAHTPHYDGVPHGQSDPAVIAIFGLGPVNMQWVDPSMPVLRQVPTSPRVCSLNRFAWDGHGTCRVRAGRTSKPTTSWGRSGTPVETCRSAPRRRWPDRRVYGFAVDVSAVEAADVDNLEFAAHASELGVPAADGEVVEEDIAIRVTTGRRGGPVEQEPRPGVRASLDHQERRALRHAIETEKLGRRRLRPE